MKEKIIKLTIDKGSIDRVQQSTLSPEQWLWLKERVLYDLMSAFSEFCEIDFDLTEAENKFFIEIRKQF